MPTHPGDSSAKTADSWDEAAARDVGGSASISALDRELTDYDLEAVVGGLSGFRRDLSMVQHTAHAGGLRRLDLA